MAFPLIPLAVLGRVLVAVASVVGLGVGTAKYVKHSEKNYFNKGICKKCGGHFKYIEGTEVKGSKGYKCDVCDNCVWIDFGTDDGYIYEPSENARQ
jgi:hypothetical protein